MTLTFSETHPCAPCVERVVEDLRLRQRAELMASGERDDWRSVADTIAAFAEPGMPPARFWRIGDGDDPVAIAMLIGEGHGFVQAGFLATRRWEDGIPPRFYRWWAREIADQVDAQGFTVLVDIWDEDDAPADTAWLLRLGFAAAPRVTGTGRSGWGRTVFTRAPRPPRAGQAARKDSVLSP